MTSSETPTERPGRKDADVDEPDDVVDDDAADREAEADGAPERGDRGPWWATVMPTLVVTTATVAGWGAIGWQYHFRIRPAPVFLALGWLSVVLAVRYLWQTAFEVGDEDPGDAAWWRPSGKLDELQREKRSLLKAIKEIEFDREMGKTSEEDARTIVRVYRARAIEVIKAIDAVQGGEAGSLRDEIEREVRARTQLSAGKKGKAKAKAAKAKARAAARAAAAKDGGGAGDGKAADDGKAPADDDKDGAATDDGAAPEAGASPDDKPDRAAKAGAVQEEAS